MCPRFRAPSGRKEEVLLETYADLSQRASMSSRDPSLPGEGLQKRGDFATKEGDHEGF